jgi:Na+-driven multidrug efflux pump
LTAAALPIANIVTGIIVGNALGALSFGAVNASFPIIQMYYFICATIGIGGSTLVAVAKGKNDNKTSNLVFTISLISLIAFGLVFTILGILFAQPITNFMMGGSVELTELALNFTRPILIFAPLLILLPGIGNFVRVEGMLTLTSIMLILADGLGVPISFILISVFHLGISGAAYGLIGGYTCGFVVFLIYLFSKKRTLRVSLNANFIKILKQFVLICKTGAPSGLSAILATVTFLVLNIVSVNTGGEDAVVALSVCSSCSLIVSLLIWGVLDAMLPVLGQVYGANDREAMRHIINFALTILITGTIVLVTFFEVFPSFFAGIFGVTDAVQLEIAIVALRIFAISYLLTPIYTFWMLYTQIIDRIGISTIVTAIEGGVVTVPVAILFAKIGGVELMWWSFLVAEVAALIVMKIFSMIIEKRTNGEWKGLFIRPVDKGHFPKYATLNSIDDLPTLFEIVSESLGKTIGAISLPKDTKIDVLILSSHSKLGEIELRFNAKSLDQQEINALPTTVNYSRSMNFNRYIISVPESSTLPEFSI